MMQASSMATELQLARYALLSYRIVLTLMTSFVFLKFWVSLCTSQAWRYLHDLTLFVLQLCPKSKPKQDPQQTRPVAPFIAGGHTISRQPVGNIYDGRYNRSRLLKPSPATIKNHVLHMDEYGNAAWFPVTHDQAYSRFPAYVEPMTAAEVCTQALIESHGPDGNKNSDAGISVKGDMHSSQAGGWTSASTAAYLYDQMN